ncbi:MAG: BPSS1187 family protein [Flavobacteriales bacterium]
MKKYGFIWICLCFSIVSLSAQTIHTVQPNVADPLSGTPNANHYIYINTSVLPKNKLFLFFPGSGGTPYGYREVLKLAANLGYHSVGLTYPNGVVINSLCAFSADTTCHSRARLEIFDGQDRHNGISVDEYNSIERRTLKLLEYLHQTYPTENWGQYLSGNDILWNKIIVSGHSQGGGHAGIISKIKEVDRVVMFAALDWIPLLNRNADWITWQGATAQHNYYGFIHEQDELINFNHMLTTWTNYGMNTFGPRVLSDTATPPYSDSRRLYTLLTPANDPSKFHNCVVVDMHTPMNGSVPEYLDVWTYLIDSPAQPLGQFEQFDALACTIYPNPTQGDLFLSGELESLSFTLFDLGGKTLGSGNWVQPLRLNHLASGLYFLTLTDYWGNSKTVRVVKE